MANAHRGHIPSPNPHLNGSTICDNRIGKATRSSVSCQPPKRGECPQLWRLHLAKGDKCVALCKKRINSRMNHTSPTQARSLWTKIVGSEEKKHLGCGGIVPSYGKPPALSDWLIGTHGQSTSRMTTTFYLMDKSIARKISDMIKNSVGSERAGSPGSSW